MTITLPEWLEDSLKRTATDRGLMHTQMVLAHLVDATRPGGHTLELLPRALLPVPLFEAVNEPVPARINGQEVKPVQQVQPLVTPAKASASIEDDEPAV